MRRRASYNIGASLLGLKARDLGPGALVWRFYRVLPEDGPFFVVLLSRSHVRVLMSSQPHIFFYFFLLISADGTVIMFRNLAYILPAVGMYHVSACQCMSVRDTGWFCVRLMKLLSSMLDFIVIDSPCL